MTTLPCITHLAECSGPSRDEERFAELREALIACPKFRREALGNADLDAVATIDPDDAIAIGQALSKVYVAYVDTHLMSEMKSRYLHSTIAEQCDELADSIDYYTESPRSSACPFPPDARAGERGTSLSASPLADSAATLAHHTGVAASSSQVTA